MVLPGSDPTLAKFFLLRSLFITDDFPTFDFPAKTTVGNGVFINCWAVAADFTNSARLRLSFAIIPSLSHDGSFLFFCMNRHNCVSIGFFFQQNRVYHLIHTAYGYEVEL